MMKAGNPLIGLGCWLLAGQLMAQQDQKVGLKAGLKGEYYNGPNFERKVLTRIDPQLDFTWKNRSPASGIDQSYYSVRWTGKLVAPASGRYTFNAKVDDGIRIWVGNRKVMDIWRLNDSKAFTGSIVLEAGHTYDLRIDYFNAMLGGVIELYWVRPDAEKPIFGTFGDEGELIAARYFRQPTPPVAASTKPIVAVPVITSPAPVKAINKPPVVASAKPVKALNKPHVVASATPVRPTNEQSETGPLPVSRPTPAIVATTTTTTVLETKPVVLRQVQFEQSSYILSPGSEPELETLVQALRTNPTWHVEISGHTDNVGDPRLNQTLSEYRARVVKHYLTRQGIADDRIATNGYGGSRPIDDNGTEAGRIKNRRVEFVLK